MFEIEKKIRWNKMKTVEFSFFEQKAHMLCWRRNAGALTKDLNLFCFMLLSLLMIPLSSNTIYHRVQSGNVKRKIMNDGVLPFTSIIKLWFRACRAHSLRNIKLKVRKRTKQQQHNKTENYITYFDFGENQTAGFQILIFSAQQ